MAASAGWRAEINAVIENGARLVALAGQEANTKWNQLELVMHLALAARLTATSLPSACLVGCGGR